MKSLVVTSLLLSASTASFAAPFVVDAYLNASTGGTGLATVALNAGDAFSVTASTDDLWSLGPLPRMCDADGLVGNRYATATDDSGQPIGTLIGMNFGLRTQGGLTAPYGALVGRIDAGNFFLIGTNYNGVAATSGTLYLYCFDADFENNSGNITANVEAVPEPGTLAAVGLGLAALRRRRR